MNADRCFRAARAALLCLALPSSLLAAEGELVWTGRGGSEVRPEPPGMMQLGYGGMSIWHRVRPGEHASALRADLAALRLTEATQGPSPEREAVRLELWIRACDDEAFAGQGELLVELALERAERLAARGETEAALAATQELLVPARLAAQAGEFQLREADAAWLERAAAWLADPALVTLRAELAPPQEAQAASQDVASVIEGHLRKGNIDAVMQFGLRAVPVAERLVRAEPESYPALAADDALTVLFKLSEERGARIALELLVRPSEVLPVRVLRAMRAAEVLSDEETWEFVEIPGRDPNMRRARLREPIWCEVLERLCENPLVAADACAEIGQLVFMDALTSGLARFLESAILGADPALARRALEALSSASGRESARALLEELLACNQESVRSFAAERLSRFEESPALWARVHDSSVAVRIAVLAALRPYGGWEALSIFGFGQEQWRNTGEGTLRGLDRGGMAALEALLADDEPRIYLEALDILRDNPDLPMSAATLRGLTGHPDARVRSLLARLRVGDLPDPHVLEALAADADPEVVGFVDDSMQNLAAVGPLPTADNPLRAGANVLLQMSTPWSDEFLPALRRRLVNPVRRPEPLAHTVQVAAHTPQGARSLAELGVSAESESLAPMLVESFSDGQPWDGGVTPWELVDPSAARDLLARAWRTAPTDWGWVSATANRLREGPPAYRIAALEWLADARLPWSVRFLAAVVSEPLADDAWRGQVLQLLATPDPAQLPSLRDLRQPLLTFGMQVPDRDLAGRMLADLVAHPTLAEDFASPLAGGLAQIATLDAPTADRILERWASQWSRFDGTLKVALGSVEASEEAPKSALFERLLRESYDAEDTFQTLGRLHLRAHLPLLERALAGEFMVNPQLKLNQQRFAAAALACYFDDVAAEILLRGVGATTDTAVRDACFAALDTIRRYQDERARWTSRSDAGRARAETIAELVGLIETGDAAQKVEAVRALGTLEALEELPRLVRLSGSRDAALAKAAKEALERIHASGGGD